MTLFTIPPFTKGTWLAFNNHVFSLLNLDKVIHEDEKDDIVLVATVEGRGRAELSANAMLIAEAPEMYRLLKSVVEGTAFEFDDNGHRIFTEQKANEFREVLRLIEGLDV